MSKIKVFLADDHAVLRAGLKALLNAQPDIQVVGEAANGEDTIQQCERLCLDIVVMDITMPRGGGVETTEKLKIKNPAIKVLALTMHEDEEYLKQMLCAGADSYVPKKAADTDLLAAIRATYRGEHFIHSSMTGGLLAGLRPGTVSPAAGKLNSDGLSEREVEVLRLLAAGHTNQEIADKLYLSIKTVETYKARLKDKLNVKGRAELVRYAIEMGLLGQDSKYHT